jgi:nucleoid-associated protein YgaU
MVQLKKPVIVILSALFLFTGLRLIQYAWQNMAKPTGEITTQAATTTTTFTSKPEAQTYTIQVGDTLFDIGVKLCGDPYLWPVLANQNNISNPHLIYPERTLVIQCAR